MEADLWYSVFRQRAHKKKLTEIKNRKIKLDDIIRRSTFARGMTKKKGQNKQSLIKQSIEKNNQKTIRTTAHNILEPKKRNTDLVLETRNLNIKTEKPVLGCQKHQSPASKKTSITSLKLKEKLPSIKKCLSMSSKKYPNIPPIQLSKVPTYGSEDLFLDYFSSSSSESYIRIFSPPGQSSSRLDSST